MNTETTTNWAATIATLEAEGFELGFAASKLAKLPPAGHHGLPDALCNLREEIRAPSGFLPDDVRARIGALWAEVGAAREAARTAPVTIPEPVRAPPPYGWQAHQAACMAAKTPREMVAVWRASLVKMNKPSPGIPYGGRLDPKMVRRWALKAWQKGEQKDMLACLDAGSLCPDMFGHFFVESFHPARNHEVVPELWTWKARR